MRWMAVSGNLSTTRTFMEDLLRFPAADPRSPIVAPAETRCKAHSGGETSADEKELLPLAESEDEDADEDGDRRDQQDEHAVVEGARGFDAAGRGAGPAGHAS